MMLVFKKYALKIGVFLSFTLTFFAFQNCTESNFALDADTQKIMSLSTYEKVSEEVLQPFCFKCHSGENPVSGRRFDTYQSLISYNVITPGNSANSRIIQRIENDEMPLDGFKNPADKARVLKALSKWIDEGAKEFIEQPRVYVPPLVAINDGSETLLLPNGTTQTTLSLEINIPEDSDVKIKNIAWTLDGTEGATLDDANPMLVTIDGMIDFGDYNVEVTVTDNHGKATSATLLVEVGQHVRSESFVSLQLSIFAPHCAGCHSGPSPQAGFDITSYTSVKTKLNLAAPILATNSALYSRISRNQGDPLLMPKNGNRLSEAQIEKVKTWIEAGAPQ